MADTITRRATNRDLPDGWRRAKLGEVCVIVMGQSPEGTTYNRDGDGVELLNGPTEFGPLHPKPVQWTSSPTKFANVGDVLLCVRGATTGRKNIADKRYCIGRGLAAIHGKELVVDSGFLWYALDIVTDTLLKESAGSTFPNLPGEKLEQIEIALPPFIEQQRLAAILSGQLAAVERARAAVEVQLAAARQLPAAYLRGVFESEEAQEWPRRRLGEVCEIDARQVDPKIPEYGALPHVNGENIESGTCRLLYLNSAAEDGMTSGKYLFRAGEVLYSKLRPYLRKVVVAEFNGLCSADMYPIKVSAHLLDPRFLAWLLLSDEFTTYADDESRRARMPKLNREQLFAWEAPVPPLLDQQRIASYLDSVIKQSVVLWDDLQGMSSEIDKLPTVLLQQAFSGEQTYIKMASLGDSASESEGMFFRRGAIASYIIGWLQAQPTFGRVQFEKVLNLTETHVGIDLEGHYERAVAGPYDGEFLAGVEKLGEQKGWFTQHRREGWGYFYRTGPNIREPIAAAEDILGERRPEMDRLLGLVARMDTEQTEIVATLFAAWNDFLLDGHQPSDADIIHEVRENWHPSKQRFEPERLQSALDRMRKDQLIPRGIGPHTEVRHA